MTTIFNNSYIFIKSVYIGEGVKNTQKSIHVVCARSLIEKMNFLIHMCDVFPGAIIEVLPKSHQKGVD